MGSINQSCEILKKLIFQIFYTLGKGIISHLFAVDSNWKLFEQKIKDKSNFFKCFIEEKSKIKENDEKILKIFGNNERYEGGIAKGKLCGIGKYFYADGSVYIGEFKNNLRNGLGNFRFSDGRIY